MCGGQFRTEKRVDQNATATSATATTATTTTSTTSSVSPSAMETKLLEPQQQATAPASTPAPSTATGSAVGVSAASQPTRPTSKRRGRNDSTGSRESVPASVGRDDETKSGYTRASGRGQRRPPGRPRKISRSAESISESGTLRTMSVSSNSFDNYSTRITLLHVPVHNVFFLLNSFRWRSTLRGEQSGGEATEQHRGNERKRRAGVSALDHHDAYILTADVGQ